MSPPAGRDAPARVGVEEMVPKVDFACLWHHTSTVWFQYRVPSHQFLLVQSGRLRASTEQGMIEIGPGELILLRRQELNAYGYDGEIRYFEAHASFAPPPRAAAWLCVDGEPLPTHVVLGNRYDAAVAAFDGLCRVIDHRGERALLQVRRHLEQLLLAMVAEAPVRPARPAARDPWSAARALLEAKLGAAMSLGEVASGLGLSPDHLIRGFRRRYGLSPMAYRAQARLRRAAAALAEGRDDASVKRIAHEYGFADASAFARAFRRQFGLSPSEWRVAEASTMADAPTPVSDASGYPLNTHLRHPDHQGRWFTWG